MKKHDLISSLIWFILGLAIVLYAPRYDLGIASAPGPGFMPLLAGLVICFFAGITFIQSLLRPSGEKEKIWAHIEYLKLIFVLLVLFLYIFLLQKIGFLATTFLMILILMRFVGPQSWWSSLLGAGLTASLSYLLFNVWLKVQLPQGIWSF